MAEVTPITMETIDQLHYILSNKEGMPITPFEKDLINDRLNGFSIYGNNCNVTPKQVKVIEEVYKKIKLIKAGKL